MNLMKNNSTASRWVNHHVGNIQNGGPSGPALLPEGIQTQVSGDEKFLERIRQLEDELDKASQGPWMYKCWEVNYNQRENIANLGNLLTQQSRELRQEKQEKERKKKYFSEIIRRKDEKIKGLRNGKQN
ncbi:uncharacterized protein LOC111698049 isoform X5 [Eurytemora carolleeae]|uniref:uncharacterized protein LOC111698049 isoform X4 n=1 Tax=Eurytemora carolleeae TaxID=1294199 RepID=UPI000C787CC5|nr:uncharacterized protein LOC111698049 isoform X4 [Eurytemora carolleeae]XP_023324047.1 uncharacterized protein LOC111698049 isoform X5 [Eurytemora carolleeae]|eukprot:XP_023324046.1 uncharacterized protein LOC111698049 isoform X4 [Eurytemora affinis]